MRSQNEARPGSAPRPICRSTEAVSFYAKYGCTLVRCATCSAIYVSPIPTRGDLAAHYQKAEYFFGECEQGYLNEAGALAVLIFRRTWRSISWLVSYI